MRISFIATVYNEEKTIEMLLDSVFNQTQMPDEVIITDGGSNDNTITIIKEYIKKNKNFPLTFYIKNGNRSVGRNEAIKHTTGDIIVCTDAGCILDKDWVKNVTRPFKDNSVDVVAGYYKGKPENTFQMCQIPYVIVMEDKVNPQTFLPATRSIAFKKSIWSQAGKFPEKLSHNEDYAFARKLKNINANIVFRKDAIVYWIPRKNLSEAFTMFYRFAKGDAEARIFRPKVVLIFVRYLFLLSLCLYSLLISRDLLFLVLLLIFFYLVWSVLKNYKYIKKIEGFFYLPLIQLTSDLAVIKGTLSGLFIKF